MQDLELIDILRRLVEQHPRASGGEGPDPACLRPAGNFVVASPPGLIHGLIIDVNGERFYVGVWPALG